MATLPPPAPIGNAPLCIPRPGFGSLGYKSKVWVNHFAVQYRSKNDIYHYDFSIAKKGEKPTNENGFSKALCESLIKTALYEKKNEFKGIDVVSDGRKNLFSPQRLPFKTLVLKDICLPEDKGLEKPNLFDIYIKEADPVVVSMIQLDEFFGKRLNYTPYDCIQALDVALRHSSSQRFVAVGRNFFSNERPVSISECADIWFGFHQSLRPTQSGITLNIDTAATAFVRKMPVLDFIMETLNARTIPTSMSPRDIATCSKALRGVKIRITHRANVKPVYRVNSLSKEAADKLFFEADGKKISVADHFAKTYKKLKYPSLPCLHVGALNRHTYFPMEVCETMEGQKVARKLSEKQVADVIKVTCLRPNERIERIKNRLQNANFANDPHLKAFGLSADPRMIEAETRVLPQAELLYGRKQVERPRLGAWNMKDKAFYNSRIIDSMAVISCADRLRPDSIQRFLKELVKMMNSLGMKAPNAAPPVLYKTGNQSFMKIYQDAIGAAQKTYGKEPQLILVIKPTSDAFSYGEIKRASDTKFGIVSQCMLAKHAEKANPQYIANILMKINVKLGGINAVTNDKLPCISGQPTIVFGADVTHPSPSENNKPSIAAVVASMDAFASYHAATARQQGHRVEQIEDLKSMVISLLKRFYISTKCKPARILFYRDGVSEGQFQMVLQYEVAAIREACRSLEKNYCPPITFVIVQKRHHTRLFPMNQKDSDRSGNCVPGTIVEKQICHPHEYDFYLMSHSGIQGTSRPTHYHVLMDENRFKVDDLQLTTYKLCYTFARCTRSVSIVPAAYYAHLVAFRARFFLDDSESDKASQRSGKSGTSTTTVRMAQVHSRLDRIMYYI